MEVVKEVSVDVLVWAHLIDHACEGKVDDALVSPPSFDDTVANGRRWAALFGCRPAQAYALLNSHQAGNKCALIKFDRQDVWRLRPCWPCKDFDILASGYAELESTGVPFDMNGEAVWVKHAGYFEKVGVLRGVWRSRAPNDLPDTTDLASLPAVHRTIWDTSSERPFVLDGMHRLIALALLLRQDGDASFECAFAFAYGMPP